MGCQLHLATQKKKISNLTSPIRREKFELDLSMVLLRKRKELLACECVALTRLRISGQFWCQTE